MTSPRSPAVDHHGRTADRTAATVDSPTWLSRLEPTAISLAVAATLLCTTALMTVATLGDPELAATVALLGISVVLLGIGTVAVARRLDGRIDHRTAVARGSPTGNVS
jgi:hypothetical protein